MQLLRLAGLGTPRKRWSYSDREHYQSCIPAAEPLLVNVQSARNLERKTASSICRFLAGMAGALAVCMQCKTSAAIGKIGKICNTGVDQICQNVTTTHGTPRWKIYILQFQLQMAQRLRSHWSTSSSRCPSCMHVTAWRCGVCQPRLLSPARHASDTKMSGLTHCKTWIPHGHSPTQLASNKYPYLSSSSSILPGVFCSVTRPNYLPRTFDKGWLKIGPRRSKMRSRDSTSIRRSPLVKLCAW